MIQNMEQALCFIHSCNKFGAKKDDLKRMRALLKALGNPERLYPIVHVTGTNGKGSTASILSSVLRKAGYRTGLFTSPFLVKFNERIRIDGTSIPDADLIRLTRQVQSACESIVQEGFDFPLEFEVVTALGYLYFAQQHVDIAVVEVGLGGLLDSTNTIDPLVSVITSIGFDHTHILGNTIEEIAAQKAGIIKAGRPVVVAPQVYPEALQVIASTAKEKVAALCQAQVPECTFVREGLILEDGTKLSMAGAHQAINLGCALETIRVLQKEGFAISSVAIHQGIENARWDGRCQWVHDDLLIDGAHNSAGAAVLSDYLTEFASDRPIVMLFTAMRDKDVSSCIKILAPHAASVVTCEIMAGRGEAAEVLAQQFSTFGAGDVQAISDAEAAFAKATSLAKECGGIALCAGSLYLAGFI
ncbi:MAG: bifunctional folylpolyglutamate synthase/dihydrofolate synthase, partial [Clostridia bacterium]|nr:bifunctional folylpolyglutamate synthase/dihydrofolate synthase [Clostridia bacterium]